MWEPLLAARMVLEQRRFPTLDPWLAGLHRGELDQGAAPDEKSAYFYLPRRVYSQMEAAHKQLWKRWPRLCTCGEEFPIHPSGKAVSHLPGEGRRRPPGGRVTTRYRFKVRKRILLPPPRRTSHRSPVAGQHLSRSRPDRHQPGEGRAVRPDYLMQAIMGAGSPTRG